MSSIGYTLFGVVSFHDIDTVFGPMVKTRASIAVSYEHEHGVCTSNLSTNIMLALPPMQSSPGFLNYLSESWIHESINNWIDHVIDKV